MKFHKLDISIPLPDKFTYPFCYVPHPSCVASAEQLMKHIRHDEKLKNVAAEGKMFGVLVVKNDDGDTGFLAAYSGTTCYDFDNGYFVPPVYDYLKEDGFFKIGEREIDEINERISTALHDSRLAYLKNEIDKLEKEAEKEICSYRKSMEIAKKQRDEKRISGCSDAEEEKMKDESRFMKAELKRLRIRKENEISEVKRQYDVLSGNIEFLKMQRRIKSDALQNKLFRHFEMLDKDRNKKNVCDIFRDLGAGVPPSGTGECCAPKMIQYAFANGYRIVAMAEFWYGKTPSAEIRHHMHYYPSCMGKCKPLLTYMLRGIETDPDPMEHGVDNNLKVLYEDDYICIADKPSGMPSVEGRIKTKSAEAIMQSMLPECKIKAVHRLDMDTSGLIMFSKDDETYCAMQRLFAERKVKKRYTALLEGVTEKKIGRISLPLSPDYINRPMQIVDKKHGKEAITSYRVLSSENGITRISLIPVTGRTHQLRVHCASSEGLSMPIVGDNLYGRHSERLLLHATSIDFVHPVTGKKISVHSKPEF